MTSRINVRMKRDKITGYKRIKRLDKMCIYKDKDQDKRTGYERILEDLNLRKNPRGWEIKPGTAR